MLDLIDNRDIIEKLKGKGNRHFMNVFTHRYHEPYSEPLKRFILLTKAFKEGRFLRLVNTLQIDRYNASEAMFEKIKDKDDFIIKCVNSYVETHPDSKMSIDQFMLGASMTSPFLTMAIPMLQADRVEQIKKDFSEEIKDLLREIMIQRGSPYLGWIYFMDWWEANHERLEAINRATWMISPLADKIEALEVYLQFMVAYRLNSLHIHSKDWFKFLGEMTEEYSIQFDGEPIPITYTEDYKHETVTKIDPLGWVK